MARLQRPPRQRSSASDSNFRCRKGEWPACSSRRGSDLPRPILISVAAKENGSACNGRGGYVVRFRFHSPLQRRKMVPPATAVAATRSASDSILRCREGEWFRLQNATTPPMHRFLISRPDLGIDAAENSFACSSRCGSDLPHPILIFVAAKENGPPAATAAAAIFRIRF